MNLWINIEERRQRLLPWGLCALLFFVLLGAASRGFAQVQPSPALLVLNKSDNTLSIVDPATLKVVGRVPTGVGPHEVVASADGKIAYVANYGDQQTVGSTLSIIDIPARKEIRKLDLGELKRPHGIIEKKGFIYFTSEVKKCVARYNPELGKVDWTAQTDQNITHMLAASPDGSRIYTANILSDTVSMLDLASKKVTNVKVGPKPEGLDVAPNGKEVWVGHNADGGVSIIDTTTGTVAQTLAVCQTPIRIKFTPDGKRVLISDPQRGELYIYDAKTRKELKRIPIGAAAVGILVAPEGKRAYVASMAENKVFVVDLDLLKVVDSIEPGGMPDGMAWAGSAATTGKSSSALAATVQ